MHVCASCYWHESDTALNLPPAVIFCGDHSNDCGYGNLLAHGAMPSEISMLPQLSLDEGGTSWDGGPATNLPLLKWAESRPLLTTSGEDSPVCLTYRCANLGMIQAAEVKTVFSSTASGLRVTKFVAGRTQRAAPRSLIWSTRTK